MFPTNSNFKSSNESLLCPKCESNRDTTEHIVHCYTNVKIAVLKKEDSPAWSEIVKGFTKYKKDKDKRDAVAVQTKKSEKSNSHSKASKAD